MHQTTSAIATIRTCDVPGCDRDAPRRKQCEAHYARMLRTGSYGEIEVRRSSKGMTPEETYEFYADRNGPDDCIEWTGDRDVPGYAIMSIDGKRVRVSRWLMERKHGVKLGRWDLALHSCDWPPCVCEGHIRVGTHAENMADRAERGRTFAHRSTQRNCKYGHLLLGDNLRIDSHGYRQCVTCDERRRLEGAAARTAERLRLGLPIRGYRSKLTETDVREIRRLAALGVMNVTLAEKFSVTATNIIEIVRRNTWKNVA